MVIKKCKATTRKKTHCRKPAMSNSDYCYIHSFGHLKRVPWWKNFTVHLTVPIVLSIVTIVLPLILFYSGPTKKNQQEILDLLQQMRAIDMTQSEELLRKYPLGYVLFGNEHGEEIITLSKRHMEEIIEVDWANTRLELAEDHVTIRFPPFLYKKFRSHIHVDRIVIPRNVGRTFCPMAFPDVEIIVELLVDNGKDVICALGFRKPKGG